MTQFNDISFDIETLGTNPGSAVLSIGAVAFNSRGGVSSKAELEKASIEINIDLDDSLSQGFKVKASTIQWWFQQSKGAVLSTFFPKQSLSVERACHQLTHFIENSSVSLSNVKVWGNGANFDVVLIEDLYRSCGKEIPWKFWNIRCLRTLKETIPYDFNKLENNALAHNCLADAIHQAQLCQLLHASLGNTLKDAYEAQC